MWRDKEENKDILQNGPENIREKHSCASGRDKTSYQRPNSISLLTTAGFPKTCVKIYPMLAPNPQISGVKDKACARFVESVISPITLFITH